MDYYTIVAQRAMLERDFVGRRIETMRISDTYTVSLGFDDDLGLRLSSIPDMPYLHTVEKRYLPQKKARSWYQKHFSGSTLTDVDVTYGDRILSLKFDTGCLLIFEMTGRHANIVLADPEGILFGVLRTVTGSVSAIRQVMPGIPYVPPPARDFPDLVWGPLPVLERSIRSVDGSIRDALRNTVCCGSDLFAREALARAGIDPGANVPTLSGDELLHLLKVSATLAVTIERGGAGATIVMSEDGIPKDVFPERMTATGIEVSYDDDLDEAIKSYSRNREIALELKSLRAGIIGALNREERSTKSTIKKIKRECGDDSEPELLEQQGNTLLANLHRVQRGMTSVVLDDPYGTGDREIDLDPKLDGPANAQRLFTRSRKLRQASKHAVERLKILEERLEHLSQERDIVAVLEDVKKLRELSKKQTNKQGSTRSEDPDIQFPRRFKSRSGLDIIVGRNDRENDGLVRWARKNDLWLHAQNIGGSHVILRTPGKQPPDHWSIEQAAAIAAYYSKGKTSAIVPVVCTLVKYVVKRRGQGPGKVTYTREKVLSAEPGIPSGES